MFYNRWSKGNCSCFRMEEVIKAAEQDYKVAQTLVSRHSTLHDEHFIVQTYSGHVCMKKIFKW